MRFSLVTLYIKDMERSIGFYHGLLGLALITRHPTGEGELAMLGEADKPHIELIALPQNAQNTYTGFSIAFQVPSHDAAVKEFAEKGYPVIRGPFSPAPNITFSFIKDPDGVEIQLIEMRQ